MEMITLMTVKMMMISMFRMRIPNHTKGLQNPITTEEVLRFPSSRAAAAFALSLRPTWAML